MKRRAFLIRGALGGAAITLVGAGYLALRRSPVRLQPTKTLLTLNETTFGVVAAPAAVHVTSKRCDPVLIAHAVDAVLAFGAPENARDLNRVLAAFESGLLGLFTRTSLWTFTELSVDEQRDAVRAWSTAPIPLLAATCDSLRRLTVGAHYAQLENSQAVGYPGPPFIKADPPPIVADQPLSPPFDTRPLPPAEPVAVAGDGGPAPDAATEPEGAQR